MPRYPATIQVRVTAAQQYALEQIAEQLGVPYADVVRQYLPSEPLSREELVEAHQHGLAVSDEERRERAIAAAEASGDDLPGGKRHK